jgi:methionyl-tRNA formyltransferase
MFALASNRPWNEGLCQRLESATGQDFIFLRAPGEIDEERLSDLGIETIFFPHWSFKIPPAIFDNFECVIFHMTDVPYGRGGSPLQNLIVRGHEETVITALRCVEEMDAGPVYLKRPLSLLGSAEEIYLRADRVIEAMIVALIEGRPSPTPQNGEVTIFKRRRPDQGNWSGANDLDAVFDFIRMLDATGYPPAFVDVGPFRLEFSRAARRTDAVFADVRITVKNAGDKNP